MFPFPWTEHGLPQLDPADVPSCGGSEMQQRPCTREGMPLLFFFFLGRQSIIKANTFNRIFSRFCASSSSISATRYADILEYRIPHFKLCFGDNSKQQLRQYYGRKCLQVLGIESH
jgi:hypothetical protein